MSPVAIASASARSRAIPNAAPYFVDQCLGKTSCDGKWDDEISEWACTEGVCDCECYEESEELESEASSWGSTLSTCSESSGASVERTPTLTRRRSLFEDQEELFDSYDKTAAPCCPPADQVSLSQAPKLRPPIPLTFTKIDPLLRPGQSAKSSVEADLDPASPTVDPVVQSPSLLARSLQYFSFNKATSATPTQPIRSAAKAEIAPSPPRSEPRSWDEESEIYTVSVMLQTFNARLSSKIPPMRPVANSAQYRMMAIESAMIKRGKISAPLRQRNYRWRKVHSNLRRSESCLSVGNLV